MIFSPSNIKLWSRLGSRPVFGITLSDIAKNDDDLIVLTADLKSNNGLDRFENYFPDRLINVGICEENLIGVSAGLAREGKNVFSFSFAPFITARCLDFIRINMGFMGFPVNLVGLGGGLSFGDWGYSHTGTDCLAFIRPINGITVLCPADCTETVKTLSAVAKYDKPTYIHLTGVANNPIVYNSDYDFEIGKAITLCEGEDISIIACGTMVAILLKVAKALESTGISCKVVDMHTIKPLDTNAIDLCLNSKLIVTAEEHSVIGGLGSAVAEYLSGKEDKPPQMIIGIPERYFHEGKYDWCMEQAGLTADIIYKNIKEKLQ